MKCEAPALHLNCTPSLPAHQRRGNCKLQLVKVQALCIWISRRNDLATIHNSGNCILCHGAVAYRIHTYIETMISIQQRHCYTSATVLEVVVVVAVYVAVAAAVVASWPPPTCDQCVDSTCIAFAASSSSSTTRVHEMLQLVNANMRMRLQLTRNRTTTATLNSNNNNNTKCYYSGSLL